MKVTMELIDGIIKYNFAFHIHTHQVKKKVKRKKTTPVFFLISSFVDLADPLKTRMLVALMIVVDVYEMSR